MRSRIIFPTLIVLGWLMPVSNAVAGTIFENAVPNVYTVQAGGTFTLRGSIIFPDAASYQYGVPMGCGVCWDEILNGLTSTAPHLGIVGGSVLSSQDFSPPIGGTYFVDEFLGPAGFLGPATQIGPAITAVTDWREFVVPVGTPPGVYNYSYGILYLENGDFAESTGFASNLQVNVTGVPEPASLLLLGTGLMSMVWRQLRGCDSSKAQRERHS